MLENKVEKDVVKWAKARKVICLKLNLIGNTGWPDRLFLAPGGRWCFIEFKRPGRGKALDRNQPARVAKLRQYGFTVGVLDDISEAIAFLEATLFPEGGA